MLALDSLKMRNQLDNVVVVELVHIVNVCVCAHSIDGYVHQTLYTAVVVAWVLKQTKYVSDHLSYQTFRPSYIYVCMSYVYMSRAQ